MEIAKANSVTEGDARSKESKILPAYERHFERAIGQIKPRILPGVTKLLESLIQRDVKLALYSGESRRTLNIVLNKTKLDRFFEQDLIIGASRKNSVYDRKKLLQETIEKAEKRYERFSENRTFLFDDSTKGISSGNELGIVTIGVSTGPEEFEKLKTSAPTYLFRNFSNLSEVLHIMGES